MASAAGMTVVVVAAADSAGVAATGDPGVGETTFTTASTMACDTSTTACALALAARVTRCTMVGLGGSTPPKRAEPRV